MSWSSRNVPRVCAMGRLDPTGFVQFKQQLRMNVGHETSDALKWPGDLDEAQHEHSSCIHVARRAPPVTPLD